MTANQILISVIGLFLFATGIIYILHLKEKGGGNKRESTVSYSLMVAGLVIFLLPFLGMIRWSGGEDKKQESVLMGEDAFSGTVPASADKHAEASAMYEKGVSLWSMELNAYDSVSSAMNYFDKSIALFETAEALTARGQLKIQLSKMNEAMKDYDRAIEVKPDFGNAYFNRAALFYIFGDTQKACDDWKKAEEFGVPRATDVLASLCN